MVFDRLKNSFEDRLGNEILGEADVPEMERPKPKVEPKPKVVKQPRQRLEVVDEDEATWEKLQKEQKQTKKPKEHQMKIVEQKKKQPMGNVPKKKKTYPVLDIFKIQRSINLDDFVTPEMIENVEFTLTAPTGINPDEVERFMDYIVGEVIKLREALQERQSSFECILEEHATIEQKLIDKQQESELTSLIVNTKSKEEKLREQLVNLQLENQDLRNQLARAGSSLRSTATRRNMPNIDNLPSLDGL